MVSVFTQADMPRNFGRSEISGDLTPGERPDCRLCRLVRTVLNTT